MDNKEERMNHAKKLYEGKVVPHHSCGICLAATFGLKPSSYQSLRKGGITGEGECGAIKGGEMVLGEYLGDPDPTGPVTESLREAAAEYKGTLSKELKLDGLEKRTCDALAGGFSDFQGDERKDYCAELVVEITRILCRILEKKDAPLKDPISYQ